ncbi:MAG: AGE family epimerase/isomerase [Bacteroidales bacterium]|nr:AGE family epimerase/isomerase [Bacteroidales bacterium]
MTKEEKIAYLVRSAQREVEENILNYWYTNMLDNEQGGFYGSRDFYNRLNAQATKGAVLNSRILWTFSKAYNVFKKDIYLEVARRAYEYLENYFRDPKYDGIYWELDYKGIPINMQKYGYAQGFWMYGLVEYHKASGNREALQTAMHIFSILQEKAFDTRRNGYWEAFARDWSFTQDVRISEKDLNENKTFNTHLHLLEPFTTLYQATQDIRVGEALRNVIELMFDRFYNSSTGHFHLFFDDEWHVKGDLVSYGHDIEGSWLLWEAIQALGTQELKDRYVDRVVQIVEVSALESIDEDGGQFYEGNSGGVVDTDKHWWPQAESVVSFINAWQITGEEKFLEYAYGSWRFIEEKLIDKSLGEWHWKVDRKGNPDTSQVRAGFWKCPYHNSRACFEIIKRLGN